MAPISNPPKASGPKINPTKIKRINNYAIYLDKYQEDLLHDHLYFIGKLKEITLESKINKQCQ